MELKVPRHTPRPNKLRLVALYVSPTGHQTKVLSSMPYVSIGSDRVLLGDDASAVLTRVLGRSYGLPNTEQCPLLDPSHPAVITCRLGKDGYLTDPGVDGVKVVPVGLSKNKAARTPVLRFRTTS